MVILKKIQETDELKENIQWKIIILKTRVSGHCFICLLQESLKFWQILLHLDTYGISDHDWEYTAVQSYEK